MYEKNGLMSKVRNPLVISYLRINSDRTNTDLVESALCKKLGIPAKTPAVENRGNKKIPGNINCIPVKIRDRRLIDYIISQKQLLGISHRHTVESAILEQIAREIKR